MNGAAVRPWLAAIPGGWSVQRIKHVVRFAGGGTPSKAVDDYWGGDIPWVSPKDMKVFRISESQDNITEAALASSACSRIPIGATLMVVRSGILQHTIPVAINEVPVCLNQDMKALIPEEGMVSEYLAYLIQGLNDRLLDEWVKQGATVESIEHQSMANTPIPVPPLEQQLAIASYLDVETARIDGLIDAKGELLALLRGLDLTAFFGALAARAVGKPGRTDDRVRWLANLPFSWERCKVKHLVLSFDQGVSPQCESRVPDEGEWGVLKVGCVNSGQFDPLESKALPLEISPVPEVTVEEGDLLVSRANTKDLVGRSAVAARSFPRLMLSDKLYRLKLDRTRCLPDFVRRLMWIPSVRQMIEERATGASPSMLNIDRRTILELPIPLPPVDEQEQILQEAEKANSAAQYLIRHVENEIDLLREMRSATVTDAVLGRIDVRAHMKH